MKSAIEQIIAKIEAMHINDPRVNDELDEITRILATDETRAIETINLLDENTINWISSLFADLAYVFQSRKFIETIVALEQKFPMIDLRIWIDDAIEAMD